MSSQARIAKGRRIERWMRKRGWNYTKPRNGVRARLHALAKKPRTCQAVPPRGTGGYSHWHCTEPRHHDGMHRYRSYVWGDIDGEPIGAHHMPTTTP